MKVEELLKPRYKVIAPWPDADYEVGDIIQLTDGGGECDEFYSTDEDGKFLEWERFYLTFPHLFKKLEWHEERSKNDMPKYIRWTHPATKEVSFFEVFQWLSNSAGVYVADIREYHLFIKDFLPATEQEYNDYLKPQTV